MRLTLKAAAVFLLLTPALVASTKAQTASDTALAPFRAITPDQQIRAARFDRPTNPPLQPNHTIFEDVESALPPHDPPEYEPFLQNLVCGSDLVVVGRATQKRSFLTKTNSSLFTDYSFAPEELIHGGTVLRRPGSTAIEVSLQGGVIDTPNGRIEVTNQPPLNFGDRYLLFLRQIPQTSSFELAGPQFTIDGVSPRLRSRHELPTRLANGEKNTTTVLADIRAAAAKCQKGAGK